MIIGQVLNDVGREHPQALIYPLSVAERSSDGNRGDYAAKLLDLMREHTPQVVQEGVMFSNELIRYLGIEVLRDMICYVIECQ